MKFAIFGISASVDVRLAGCRAPRVQDQLKVKFPMSHISHIGT